MCRRWVGMAVAVMTGLALTGCGDDGGNASAGNTSSGAGNMGDPAAAGSAGVNSNQSSSGNTLSHQAAQGIVNYIQEPQNRVRDANQQILDADQRRREQLDNL